MENHEEIMKLQVGIPMNEFFSTYFLDPNPSNIENFYRERGEKKIIPENWRDPEPGE